MLFLSELYQSSSQYNAAIELMEKVIQKYPGNLDYYYQLASLYLAVNKYTEAINVYNLIEEKAGVSEEITIQKEKIYIYLVDLPKAEAELKKLIDAFPVKAGITPFWPNFICQITSLIRRLRYIKRLLRLILIMLISTCHLPIITVKTVIKKRHLRN